MKLIWAALILYTAQWVALPFVSDQWAFLLGASCFSVALLVSGISLLCRKESVLVQSVLVLWALFAWGDVVKFVAWNYSATHIDLSAPLALVFSAWLMFLLRRKYDTPSDEISPINITLLIKRPSGWWDMVKGLFGAPVSSVCLCLNHTVWAYRKRSGVYETFALTPAVRANHLTVDTGVAASPELVGLLNSLVGSPRGAIPCKCLWTIRGVLNMLGGKYEVKSWLDYVPGFYVMRVM